MASLNSILSLRLFPSSSSPSLPPFFFPPSTIHKSSSITKSRLQCQFSASASAAVVTESEPAAHGDAEKFDWFAQWYPVALIRDLDKRRPHAKTIMGLDLVVWWDRAEGRWQVFDDSCPHRLAPLSEGRIDQWGRLQCVYHGWCFDGKGSCKYIPQAPDDGPPVHTSSKACASVYPCVEQHNILWFWPNTDPQYQNIAMKEKPPYIEELDDPSYSSTTGMREFPYGYEVLIENLMDPAHVPYAHHGIMNMPKSLKNRPNADREGGSPLNITIDASSIIGFLAHRDFGFNKFIAPCIFFISSPPVMSGNGSASSSDVKGDSSLKTQQKQRRFLLIFMCIPVRPGRSRLIYVFPRNFAVWANQVIPRWFVHVGQNLILDSDLYLLHVEERKFAKIGPSGWHKVCFVPTKSDAMVLAFRNWLRKYSNGQVDWGTTSCEQLPPTPPREQLMDRYWSHVVQCISCQNALKYLKALELSLQIVSIVSIGILAAIKQSMISNVTRTAVVSFAVLCFVASKWLSNFLYKNFYYHDYDHAFK
ncbi:protochlorophyllide-dependent translocon component 52, chloroplastic [Canna indica]|uniref:Protochlorophyllide-dependent translocon component 52, chloroplastic n=1 Tax=Canna indica TaxID=4628 RepID=A0AAQ3L537_9LILI|nr:protochlorophyllide-dependent translocon component 52, chloroplastic [Canna indica]